MHTTASSSLPATLLIAGKAWAKDPISSAGQRPRLQTKRGRPEAGYFTKTTAEAWLDSTLAEARRGELVGMVRTGASMK